MMNYTVGNSHFTHASITYSEFMEFMILDELSLLVKQASGWSLGKYDQIIWLILFLFLKLILMCDQVY